MSAFIDVTGVAEQPDREMLQEMGYEGPRYSFCLLDPGTVRDLLECGESLGQQGGKTEAGSLSGLESRLEEESSVIASYTSPGFNAELEEMITRFSEDPSYSMKDDLEELVEESRSADVDEVPMESKFPLRVWVDADLSGFEDVEEAFEPETVEYSLDSRSRTADLSELDEYANRAQLRFQHGRNVLTYDNSPPQGGWTGFGLDQSRLDAAEEVLREAGYDPLITAVEPEDLPV